MDERLKLLMGENIEKIKNKTVLIIGIGGVGSYALEALTRSAIAKLIIVDNDIVEISNLNRQLITLNSNIGQLKVDVAEKRIKDINRECEVIKINLFVTKDNIACIFKEKIDYVVDACDTIETKKAIIRECLKRNIKFISSMGTANKHEPTRLKIMDIRKTSYDPIAKIIRKMVSDEKITAKIMVVSSDEQPVKRGVLGSNAFVPAVAGLLCASYVINDIVGAQDEQ